MNREEALEVVLKALNKHYENIYNGYAKDDDRNNALRTAVEAADVYNYVKENLK